MHTSRQPGGYHNNGQKQKGSHEGVGSSPSNPPGGPTSEGTKPQPLVYARQCIFTLVCVNMWVSCMGQTFNS